MKDGVVDCEGDLAVSVLEARDLVAADDSPAQDTFVRMCLLPDRQIHVQTRIYRRCPSSNYQGCSLPSYQGKFLFLLDGGPTGKTLLVEVPVVTISLLLQSIPISFFLYFPPLLYPPTCINFLHSVPVAASCFHPSHFLTSLPMFRPQCYLLSFHSLGHLFSPCQTPVSSLRTCSRHLPNRKPILQIIENVNYKKEIN